MSGGHYDYLYLQVQELADNIEMDFLNDGKYMDDDWEHGADVPWDKKRQREYDRLGDATPEQRTEIIAGIKQLIKDLKNCSNRAKCLEWYISGDIGAGNYLKEFNY